MNNSVLKYFNHLNNLPPKEKLLGGLTYYCAPLFFSTKPAVLINFNKGMYNFFDLWNSHKQDLLDKKYGVIELSSSPSNSILFIYDYERLSCSLKQENSLSMLFDFGYHTPENISYDLHLFRERYQTSSCKELGLFLGYPYYDVLGFINDPSGKNYLYCGYWKVYHNLSFALETFKDYDKAKEIALNLMH